MKIQSNHIDSTHAPFKDMYFDHYTRAVKVALYIVKDEDAAQDIVQEVFTKLWERRDQLSGVENLRSYIVQMTRNHSLDYIKANSKTDHLTIDLELKQEEGYDRENTQNLKACIEKAVAMLSPKCRLVFALSRFDGLSNDEIAEYLDVSKRTVETQISNALKMFRTDLRHIFTDYLVTFPIILLLQFL